MVSAISASQPQFFIPPAKAAVGESAAVSKKEPENKPAPKTDDITAAPPKEPQASGVGELTEDEKALVDDLKKIDREVRAHEQAHKNVGGQFAGSASFTYQAGPDGKRYAVGGEVPIDIAPVAGDPEATIAKMAVIISAALAPAKPSGQDRSVAAQAVALRAVALAEIGRSPEDEAQEADEETGDAESRNFSNISALKAYNASASAGASERNEGNLLNYIS